MPIRTTLFMVFIAETLRPQRVAERLINISAYLRDLRVSALRTNNETNRSITLS